MESRIQRIASRFLPFRIYVLLLICFLIPLTRPFIPPLIILYTLLWLPGLKIKNLKHLLSDKFFLFPVGFYFLHVTGLIYTENMKEGLFDLEVKMSLFVLPVMILSDKEFIATHFKKIVISFVAGNIIASLGCISHGIYKAISFSDTSYLSYAKFSLFHNPSYSSLYLVFSMGIIFWFNVKNDFFQLGKWFYISILVMFFFSGVVYLNYSKSGLGSAVLGMIFFLYIYIRYPNKKKPLTISLILLFTVVTVFFLRNPRILGTDSSLPSGMVHFLKTQTRSIDPTTCEGWTLRYLMNIQALELIRENPLTGVGTGDVMKKLMNKYETKNMTCLKDKRINAHNQFLETYVGIGIVGFALLLLLTFYPLVYSIKHHQILLSVFSLAIIVGFMFESMLNTQAGVVFYSLFYSLLRVGEPGKDSV